MVNAVVTGGAGFIGSHLADALSAAGEPVRCLVRPRRGRRPLPPNVEIAEGDLTTEGSNKSRTYDAKPLAVG